jgi:hypothetical protein
MAKRSASSARGRRLAKKSSATSERKIDFSDIPPISPEQWKLMKRVGHKALTPEQLKNAVIRTF